MEEEDPEGSKQAIELEDKSAEFQKQFDKTMELEKRASKADFARFRAEEDVKFAQELLEAAQLEDLARIVERAALISRTEKEVRIAEFHVEEEKESTKMLGLKRRVLDDLRSIPNLKGKMKRQNFLLDWVERQRRELVRDSANTGQRSGPRGSLRVSSEAHLSPRATEAPGVDQPAQNALVHRNRQRRRPSSIRSIQPRSPRP